MTTQLDPNPAMCPKLMRRPEVTPCAADEAKWFHAGVDAAKKAIRSEATVSTSVYAAMFVNAIARKCGTPRLT